MARRTREVRIRHKTALEQGRKGGEWCKPTRASRNKLAPNYRGTGAGNVGDP